MAQSDYELAAHVSGLNQRTEINSIFDSILTHNSGSTAPTVTKAFMMWVDTSNATYYYLKMRNHDNTAWVTLGIYTVATKTYTSYAEDTVKLTGNQTIGGNKNFTGNLLMTGASSVIGYGTGSGGTVTQLTSKSTDVTLNKPTGQIIMNNAALAPGALVQFNLFNSLVSPTDNIELTLRQSSSVVPVFIELTWAVENGLVQIGIRNNHVVALGEAFVLNYSIIKGANS